MVARFVRLSLQWGMSVWPALALSAMVLGPLVEPGLRATGVDAQDDHPVFTVTRFEGVGGQGVR